MNYYTYQDINGNNVFVAVDSQRNYSCHYKDENGEWDSEGFTDWQNDGNYKMILFEDLPEELQIQFAEQDFHNQMNTFEE